MLFCTDVNTAVPWHIDLPFGVPWAQKVWNLFMVISKIWITVIQTKKESYFIFNQKSVSENEGHQIKWRL